MDDWPPSRVLESESAQSAAMRQAARRPPHVVVIGVAAVDYAYSVDRVPLAGEERQILPGGRRPGGSAANIAAALASVGSPRVRMLGVLGDDQVGAWLRERLGACGVDTSGMTVAAGRLSPAAIILVDSAGERTIMPMRSPKHVSAADLPRPITLTDSSGSPPCCLYADQIELYDLDRRDLAGTLVVTGHAPRDEGRHLPDGLVDMVIASRSIGAWGERPLAEARRVYGPSVRWLVLTDGPRGATAYSTTDVVDMPAPPVRRVLDATGAGDAFTGGLLHTLTVWSATGRELDAEVMRSALQVGVACGASAVQTNASSPTQQWNEDVC